MKEAHKQHIGTIGAQGRITAGAGMQICYIDQMLAFGTELLFQG